MDSMEKLSLTGAAGSTGPVICCTGIGVWRVYDGFGLISAGEDDCEVEDMTRSIRVVKGYDLLMIGNRPFSGFHSPLAVPRLLATVGHAQMLDQSACSYSAFIAQIANHVIIRLLSYISNYINVFNKEGFYDT